MTLHIVFDNVPNIVDSNDTYFTTNLTISNQLRKLGCEKVILKDVVFIDEFGEFARVSQDLFSQFPEELVNIENDVFSRMTQPILFILSEIDEIVHLYGVTEIILYKGNKHRFLAAEKSEGESGDPWLYKRAWMFNSFIYDYFKDKVNVRWKEKEWSIYINAIFFLRSFILYYEAILGLLKDLFRKTEIGDIGVNQSEEVVLGTIWVKQQYKHLRGYLDSLKEYKVIYIGTPSIDGGNYKRVQALRVGDINNVYQHTQKIISKVGNSTINFREKSFYIPRSLLRKALRRTFLVFCANYFRYCNTIAALSEKYHIRAIVNNKTWNWTQSIDKNISRMINANLITLQSVMLPNVIYPNRDVFGKIFLSSKQQYGLFHTAGIDTGVYSGYPIADGVKEYDGDELIISIFLQSDMYEDVSIQLIDQFVKNGLKNAKNKVIIKPHYRQNKNTLTWIKNRIAGNPVFSLSGQQEDANEIIKASHFCVSFTSAVLFEAACYGITPISVVMNDYMKQVIYSSEKLSANAVLKYTSVELLLNDFNDPGFLITKFKQERKHYFDCLFGEEIGIEEIIK